jgi:hypothetical protein
MRGNAECGMANSEFKPVTPKDRMVYSEVRGGKSLAMVAIENSMTLAQAITSYDRVAFEYCNLPNGEVKP